MMDQLKAILGKSNFAAETDLKARLRSRLFNKSTAVMPGIARLADDDLELVSAAGDMSLSLEDQKKKK